MLDERKSERLSNRTKNQQASHTVAQKESHILYALYQKVNKN